MNKTEAIEVLQFEIELNEKHIKTARQEEAIEALNMAIEALEQEETLQNLTKPNKSDLIVKGAGEIKDGLYNIKDGKLFKYKANGGTVRTYPIVSADRPTGHWTEKEVFDNQDSEVIDCYQSARCSHCGKYHTTPYSYYFDNYNFCPNCGARMEGDEQ